MNQNSDTDLYRRHDRRNLSKEVNKQIEEFLAKGGKIVEVETHISKGAPTQLRARKKSGDSA